MADAMELYRLEDDFRTVHSDNRENSGDLLRMIVDPSA